MLSFRITRWLLAQGRENEAKVVIQRYASSRKTVLRDEDWDLVVKTEMEKMKVTKHLFQLHLVNSR